MKTILIISIILILALPGFAQNKIAFEQTPVNFIIKNAGLKVNGSIGGLEGFIMIDPANSSLLKIEGYIDPNTIETGIGLRNNHLKKTDYFNVKEYPKILMTSTEITKKSNRKYVGNFDLTIKDVRKNVSVPFTLTSIGNEYFLKGEFSINRLDFKLGEESIILSDNVTVKIEFKTNSVEKKSSL
jgi:polyisoprenoid-binding protein YceI